MVSILSYIGKKAQVLTAESILADRPRLDLSGPVLTQALETFVTVSDEQGGVEAYVQALKIKAQLFQDMLTPEDGSAFQIENLKAIAGFMPTVRRRIGVFIEDQGRFAELRDAIEVLLDGASDTTTTDARIAAFCGGFPDDKHHRWVRDTAAEILHNTDPERYPLMNRWVWDRSANTGMIREAWFAVDAGDVDHMTLDVPDGHETFVVLREELAQFLSDNGVYRDTLQYIDILCAQVYGDYISSQGGTYLRADFSTPDDPLEHTRRLLGLDGIGPKGHPRPKDIINSPLAEASVGLLD